LFAISIDQHFLEALSLAFLTCATDVFHCQGRNQRRLASLADFRFRHHSAAQWRSGVERVRGNSVAHVPLIVVAKVGRHDLEIVPRSVRERAPAIAVAHRPDIGDVSAKLIIYLDIIDRGAIA
jgi:hypothetical protein